MAVAGLVLVATITFFSALAGVVFGTVIWRFRFGLVLGALGIAIFVLAAPTIPTLRSGGWSDSASRRFS